MEAIAEAARKARYNETIIVNVISEETPSDAREIVLTATLDEENGGVVWNDAGLLSGGICNEDVGIVRHLRTKRWVLPMLNDRRRNELYNEAIRAAASEAVRRFQNRHSNQQEETCLHALDIGTGTGLLAMMACTHLQSALQSEDHNTESTTDLSTKVKVTSLEMASAMSRLAKLTIMSNGLQDSINVLEEHSCEANLDTKFMLCTSELLESALLGEGILPSLRDAWERHLHPDAVIVPQRARVYAQLIESRELVAKYRGPHQPSNTNDSFSIRLSASPDENDVLLDGNIIVPIHAESLFSSDDVVCVLTDPVMVMDIDFSRENFPGPEGERRMTTLTPISSGTAHGVLFYWELDLWEGLSYSTQHGKEPWQDHWHQCLFVFKEGDCHELRKGEATNIMCSHTDDRLTFGVYNYSISDQETKRQRLDIDDSLPSRSFISPERALQLNDCHRIATIRRGVKYALESKGKSSHFLDLSDFSLSAILAGLEGATFVSSIESSSCEVPMASALVAQANGLPRSQNGAVTQFQILQCHTASLSLQVFNNEPAAIVAAEPYYEVLEGWHLQEALNYWYLMRSLRERGLVKSDAISIPSYASIVVCGIQCESLSQAYQGCGVDDEDAKICGFSHADVKHYGDRYHLNGFSIRGCEYDYVKLTEEKEVSRLCFDESYSITGNNIEVKLRFDTAGTCHGVLYWIDYGVQVDMAVYEVLSTNNSHHRQLFQLLPKPAKVSEDNLSDTTLDCRLKLGGLEGPEDHRLEARVVIRR